MKTLLFGLMLFVPTIAVAQNPQQVADIKRFAAVAASEGADATKDLADLADGDAEAQLMSAWMQYDQWKIDNSTSSQAIEDLLQDAQDDIDDGDEDYDLAEDHRWDGQDSLWNGDMEYLMPDYPSASTWYDLAEQDFDDAKPDYNNARFHYDDAIEDIEDAVDLM